MKYLKNEGDHLYVTKLSVKSFYTFKYYFFTGKEKISLKELMLIGYK